MPNNQPTQEDAMNSVAAIAQSAYSESKMRELPDHECWRNVAIAMNNAVAIGLATNLIVPVETSDKGGNIIVIPGKTPRMVAVTTQSYLQETDEHMQGFTNADVAGDVNSMVLDFVFTARTNPNRQQHNVVTMADIFRHLASRRILELQAAKGEGNA